MDIPTITLEEHYISSNVNSLVPQSVKPHYDNLLPIWREKMRDVSSDDVRVKAMNAGGVNMQILSHCFGLSSSGPEAVKAANDELKTVLNREARFKGFCALPMKDPEAATGELERCVRQLAMSGALIDSHLDDGRYYDDDCFGPIFAKAQELDVPIYVHPTVPVDSVRNSLYTGNYDARFETTLSMASWGWHSDTALSVLRMYAGGVFRKFPRLKIIIGHMGEMLPFQLARIEEKTGHMVPEERGFIEIWKKNIWVTTSGLFTLPPMQCLLQTTDIERIMYSIDYPFSDTEQGKRFLEQLRESGLVSKEQLEMIAHKNAEKLLGFEVVL